MKLKKALLSEDEQSQRYYKAWLDKVVTNEEYPAKFLFTSNGVKTHYMSLNKESAVVLMKWLKRIYKELPEGQ